MGAGPGTGAGAGAGERRGWEGSLSGSSVSTVLPSIVPGPPQGDLLGPTGSWAQDSLQGFESLGSAVEACEQHLEKLEWVEENLLRDRNRKRREGLPVPPDDVEEVRMERARTQFDLALLHVSSGSRNGLVEARASCERALDVLVEDSKYAVDDFDLCVRVLNTLAAVCRQLGDEEAGAAYENEAGNTWLDHISGAGGAVVQNTAVRKWEVGDGGVSEEERLLLV